MDNLNGQRPRSSMYVKLGIALGILLTAAVIVAAVTGNDQAAPNTQQSDTKSADNGSINNPPTASTPPPAAPATPEKVELLGSLQSGFRAEAHYVYNDTARPSRDEARSLIASLRDFGCQDKYSCYYFLWNSRQAYENRQTTLGNPADVAATHKDQLIAFMTDANVVYYYGSTGDSPGALTIYDSTTKKYQNVTLP